MVGLAEKGNGSSPPELGSAFSEVSSLFPGTEPYKPEGPSYDILEKMRRHPQLTLGLSFIKLPLSAVNWWVECEDERIAACVDAWVRPLWPRFFWSVMRSFEFGWQPFEKVWQRNESKVLMPDGKTVAWNGPAVTYDKLRDLKQSKYKIIWEGGEYAGIRERSVGGKSASPERTFVASNDVEYGNIYGTTGMIAAYDPWYRGSIIAQFLARYLERRGNPTAVARYPEGDKVKRSATGATAKRIDPQKRALAVASSLKEHTSAALPSTRDDDGNYLWELSFLEDRQRAGQFVEALERYDQLMLRALVVPDLVVTEGREGRGSYAQAVEKAEMFAEAEEARLADWLMQINRWIVPPLVLYNFGASAPPAKIVSDGLQREDSDLIRDVVKNLVETGKMNVDIERLAERAHIPLDEEAPQGDEVEGGAEGLEDCGCSISGHTIALADTDVSPKDEREHKEIEDEWTAEQTAFVVAATPILRDIVDTFKDDLRAAFRKRNPIKAIAATEVRKRKAAAYQRELASYVAALHGLGRKSAAREMKVPLLAKTDVDSAYIATTASQIETGDTAAMTYKMQKLARDAYVQNKGIGAATGEIDRAFKTHFNRSVKGMSMAIAAEAVNTGRAAMIEPYIHPDDRTRSYLRDHPGKRVEYKQWATLFGPETCDLCAHLDGMIIRADDERAYVYEPGMVHCNCHCIWVVWTREAVDEYNAGLPEEDHIVVTWKNPTKKMVEQSVMYDPRFYEPYVPAKGPA